MIEAVLSSSGTSLEGSATRPSAANTADRPSSSGTPAATRAPNASTRMISVIGSESFSALPKSSAKAFESALFALAPPNSPTISLCAACTWSTAASTGVIAFSAAVSSPRSLKFTSTDLPSLDSCDALPLA